MTPCPAKLNLYLDVLERRADGFHDIETLFGALDFCDEIELTLRPPDAGIELHVDGDIDVPADETNLAWRAAAAWREGRAEAPGVSIRLQKRIPVGAGLGGGSSDAAGVLRGLQALAADLAPGRSDGELAALALGLGSDVPYFLVGGAAVGRGRGERLEPIRAAPSLAVVLILPPIACATQLVYANLAARIRSAPENGLARAALALQTGDAAGLRAAHYNALAVPALSAYPALARFTADVERRLGYPPCLSGSGSALFDVPDPGEMPRTLAALAGLPGRRIEATLCP